MTNGTTSSGPVVSTPLCDRLEIGQQEILKQLDRIATSPPFRNSKRYPALLRHIVENALAGRGDQLKERTIGIEVFSRPADYDTNADPVVRISAGEVRKRIAQYYQSKSDHLELRIEIPLGSYLPRFYRPNHERLPSPPEAASQDASESEVAVNDKLASATAICLPEPSIKSLPHPPLTAKPLLTWNTVRTRFHFAILYLALAAVASGWGFTRWLSTQEQPATPAFALFWQPFTHTRESVLLVIGVHALDEKGHDISPRSHASLPQPGETLLSAMTRSDMIHLSDLTSYTALTTQLTEHHQAFRTQGAADTTLEELHARPFILIGGFNNRWTMKLASELRFQFATLRTLDGTVNVIMDSQHPERTWTIDTSQSELHDTRDYALISCFRDPLTDQNVLIAAGIGKSGTEAATDLPTNESELNQALQEAKTHFGNNVQMVISTDVIEGKHGPPHVVDAYRW